MIKKALIVTVFNEENTISALIDSILAQTEMPDEIVIVDGGSRDATVSSIQYSVSSIEYPVSSIKYKTRFKVYVKRGNRSVGRNEAIRRSSCRIIAITDAGCILDKNWFKNITKPFSRLEIDAVAGYYKAKTRSTFEKSLVPYVLVMPDKVNPQDFLPATRSMAIRKSVWKKSGGFDEKLSNNEDYEFARRIKKLGFATKFERKAIVYWIPRVNFLQSFIMFFRFALGDAEAGIVRPKVLLVFARYIFAIILLTIDHLLLTILFVLYVIWSIVKNYKYVRTPWAFVFLPLIQFTADAAVISGTSIGFVRLFNKAWSRWATRVNKTVKLWEHFNILAVSLFISVCLFTVISVSFPIEFDSPRTNAINWYVINKYPKQMDYFYFEVGFVFITVTTLSLWILKIWAKARK